MRAVKLENKRSLNGCKLIADLQDCKAERLSDSAIDSFEEI